MSTLLDHRVGIKKESTYNTPVTVDRFYPFLDGTHGSWDPRPRQGMGLLGGNGRRTDLSSRRYLPTGQGEVTVKVELESKGAGVLLEAAAGASTVTSITGGAQMNFYLLATGTVQSSYTVQIVKVRNDGTEWVETYAGCTVKKATVDAPADGIVTLEVVFDARALATNTAAASQTYASAPTLFDAYQATSVGYGGSLTVPTTTAIGSGATSFTDVKGWKLEIDHGIDDSRWILGGRNQPTMGKPKVQFTGSLEFNASTVPAAVIAGTQNPFYVTYATTETLGAGVTQFHVSIPKLALTGDLPKVTPGQVSVFDVKADVLNDGTNKDFYLVYRSTDSAL